MNKCWFSHKWEYYKEQPFPDRNPKRLRLCKKCYKKQEWIWAVTPDFGSGWYNSKLTIEEERDKKLKHILK